MFICDSCCEHNGVTPHIFMKSYGACELCRRTAGCSDIRYFPKQEEPSNVVRLDDHREAKRGER